jgi:deoxyribodipyrimidine photo-lyase
MIQPTISVFWFRRDLRLHDNAGLYQALKGPCPVLPVFIFDRNILDDLQDRNDARVEFIHGAVADLKSELEALGSTLAVYHGSLESVWPTILQTYRVGAAYTNRDYEPYASQRDQWVERLLSTAGISWHTEKDHVIFEQGEVLKDDGTPYTVFTPYSRKWLARLNSRGEGAASFYLKSWPTTQYSSNLYQTTPAPLPALSELGFYPANIAFPPTTVPQSRIRQYGDTRDFPAIEGTSRLGIHYRFGTISIREKARHAVGLSAVYLNELIWRDFYSQILAHFPQVAVDPFKPAYNRVPWRDAPEEFKLWCEGKTGYPIVDAGMRELNATGYMHNRVRMITASFLTKHLLIDWRLGEAYFASKLLDFDLASNNGGWQWAAGCGTDAAPYFRIFNPTEQAKKFDPESKYIRKWVPEFGTGAYAKPMVDHVFARQRCLDTYKLALQ